MSLFVFSSKYGGEGEGHKLVASTDIELVLELHPVVRKSECSATNKRCKIVYKNVMKMYMYISSCCTGYIAIIDDRKKNIF